MSSLDPLITQIIRFGERVDLENIIFVLGCIGVYQLWVLVCNYGRTKRC